MNELRENIAAAIISANYEEDDAADAILALPEIQEMMRDAERYRWMRGVPLRRSDVMSFDGLSLKVGSDLDAAIDAAKGAE